MRGVARSPVEALSFAGLARLSMNRQASLMHQQGVMLHERQRAARLQMVAELISHAVAAHEPGAVAHNRSLP